MKTDRKTMNEIKELFASGQSIPTLAQKYNIPESRIKNWYWKQNWTESRREYETKLKNTLYETLSKQTIEIIEINLKFCFEISKLTLEETERICSLPSNEREKNLDKLLKIATITEKASKVLKNCNPDFSDTLEEQIVNELREINNKHNLTL